MLTHKPEGSLWVTRSFSKNETPPLRIKVHTRVTNITIQPSFASISYLGLQPRIFVK